MEEIEQKLNDPPQRLCSEIKLFDLCDLDQCGFKSGRYCSNHDMVSRFEKIADEEVSRPQRYIDEELDEDGEEREDGFDEYDYEDGDEDGFER